jgi:hypothetical protein
MNLMRQLNRLGLAALAALAATAASAQTAGVTNRLDYSAFKIVADRNIFDPNRYPHTSGRHESRRPAKTADTFSLVGVMSYQKGTFAFFDGSSSDYRKVLKSADTIAGFTISEVTQTQIKLTAGTNAFVLPVGAQMLRDAEGDWTLNLTAAPVSDSSQASSTESSGGDAGASPASSGGNASEVLKKLMQRREQELNR